MTTPRALSKKINTAFVVLCLVILVCAFHFPLLRSLGKSVPSLDWYGMYAFPSFYRLCVLHFHQFPLWSPYFGGGYPLFGHPYEQSFNPLSLIVLLCGAIEGTKIIVFLIFLLSALSVFYFTRCLMGYNLAGSFFSSAFYSLSAWGACQYRESNFEKLYFYFLPVVLVFLEKAVERKQYLLPLACTISLIVMCAGSITIPVMLFLLFYVATRTCSWKAKDGLAVDWRYMRIFSLALLIAFFLSLAKTLPMIDLLARKDIAYIHFPFEQDYAQLSGVMIGQDRVLSLRRLYELLFVRDAFIAGGEGDDYLHIYFGFIPVALAVVAFCRYRRKTVGYLFLFAVFTLLSFGPRCPVDLFRLLWQLHPFVRSIWRLDEYFTFPIMLVLSIVAGRSFLLLASFRSRLLRVLFILIALVGVLNMFWANRRFFESQIPHPAGTPSFNGQFYHVAMDDPSWDPEDFQKDGYFFLQQNIGMTNWLFTNLGIACAAVPRYFVAHGDSGYANGASTGLRGNPLYRGEAHFLSEENEVRISRFTPNQLHLVVRLQAPDTLVVNQNFHKGWRTTEGRILDRQGLLAVTLEKTGEYTLVLRFIPVEFYGGMLAGLVCLALSCYFLFLRR